MELCESDFPAMASVILCYPFFSEKCAPFVETVNHKTY